MKQFTKAIIATFIATSTLTMSSLAWSKDYPSKPVRVIVPYPAGDLADVIARLLGEKMANELGQPFIVENRPGASGLVGLQTTAQAAPDGYTLVMGQMGSMAVAPVTNQWPLDVRKEFKPVAMTYTNYMMFVTSNELPIKTLPELIEYSKANPGKISAATNGTGGFPHLALEMLKEETGFDFTLIPYKGSSQIITDVISGRVEMTIFGFSGLYPVVQEGSLNALAVTGRERAPTAPEIPAVNETVPGYEALGWFGFFAPAGTPDDIIEKLNSAVNTALQMPDVMKQADKLGLDEAPGTPGDLDKTWSEDYEKWGGIIKRLGLDEKQ